MGCWAIGGPHARQGLLTGKFTAASELPADDVRPPPCSTAR